MLGHSCCYIFVNEYVTIMHSGVVLWNNVPTDAINEKSSFSVKVTILLNEWMRTLHRRKSVN